MRTARIIIAILIGLHGVAHLPGFLSSWRLAVLSNLPYHTTLFGNRLDVGDRGMRVVGILWLVTAMMFVAAAVGIGAAQVWGLIALCVGTVMSLLLCSAESRLARAGLLVDLAIAGVFVLGAVLPKNLWGQQPPTGMLGGWKGEVQAVVSFIGEFK